MSTVTGSFGLVACVLLAETFGPGAFLALVEDLVTFVGGFTGSVVVVGLFRVWRAKDRRW